MAPSGLAVITLWNAFGVSWLLPLGLSIVALPLLILFLAIIDWARRGILTKPSLHPRAMTFMRILPWVAITAVVLLEIYFGPKPSITVGSTALAFVELLFIVGFVLWFLWPEVAANFAAKVLFLTVFIWLVAAAFYYGSNPFSLLLATVLAISLPRSMPVARR
jgi:hypothetical protein